MAGPGTPALPVSGNLDQNVRWLRGSLGEVSDLQVRHLRIANGPRAALVYLESLTEAETVSDLILRPLQHHGLAAPGAVLVQLEEAVLPIGGIRRLHKLAEAVQTVLDGCIILFVGGEPAALALDARKPPVRDVEAPKTEQVIRGPRDGFTEDINTGIGLIRRRIRDPRLRVEVRRLGRISSLQVALLYLEEVAAPDLVRLVRARLRRIRTDAILESGYVEQFIEDNPYSPFPQTMHTERPDRVVAALLEGRVGILVDGTPFALVLPVTAGLFLQSPEDYYERVSLATLPRLIRTVVVMISAVLPALYIVFTAFHAEILPTDMVLTVATGQARVPLPSAAEAMLMELFIELLLEASVRLPAAVGPTVSIVGALIIGESAVRAGLVGPAMVIVIAVTAIASYSMPAYVLAFSLKLLRLALIVGAALFGLTGLMTVLNVVVVHLVALESFGVPYLSPMAPLNVRDMGDHMFRRPLWAMQRRPDQFRGRGRRQPERTGLWLWRPKRGAGDA